MAKFSTWLESTQNILFHGSDSEKLVGQLYSNNRDSGWFGAGFYLTAYPEYATRWGKFVHKMIAPSGKYAEVNCTDGYNKVEYVGDAEKANQIAGGKEMWIRNSHIWSQSFQNALKQLGYIGVRVNMDQWKDVEVVVFDPSQVKTLENPNITH